MAPESGMEKMEGKTGRAKTGRENREGWGKEKRGGGSKDRKGRRKDRREGRKNRRGSRKNRRGSGKKKKREEAGKASWEPEKAAGSFLENPLRAASFCFFCGALSGTFLPD